MLDAVYRPTSSAGSALDEPERVYSVFAFQQLDDDEIARLRCHLYCPECQGLAYYRKASKDGKAACFGSRYHAADCLEFKPSSSRKLEEADAQIVNDIVLQHDAMQIDFNLAPSKQRQLHTSTKINRPLKPALTSQSPQSILADGESTPTTPVTNSQADDAKKQSELAKPKEGCNDYCIAYFVVVSCNSRNCGFIPMKVSLACQEFVCELCRCRAHRQWCTKDVLGHLIPCR